MLRCDRCAVLNDRAGRWSSNSHHAAVVALPRRQRLSANISAPQAQLLTELFTRLQIAVKHV